MIKRLRQILVLGFASALLMVPGVALACDQIHLDSITPKAATPGERVSVTGETPSTIKTGQIELRWDSPTGPVASTAIVQSTGTFSTQAIVPELSPGIHYLVVTGDGAGLTRSVFEVTAAPNTQKPSAAVSTSPASATDLWSGFDPHSDAVAQAASASSGRRPSEGLAGGAFLAFVGLAALAGGCIAALRKRTARQAA